MEREVLPAKYAKYLYRVSFTSLVSCVFATLRGVYDGALVTAVVFLCSVNYWRRPAYGWRRNIDVCNTLSCLAYQTWRCFTVAAPYTLGYLFFTYTGIAFFFLGNHLDKTNQLQGTLAHSMVHILGNIGNIILYRGIENVS